LWLSRLARAAHARSGGVAAAPAGGPGIVLDLGDAPYAGVPCWSGRAQRWARFTVPIAYDLRYDSCVRPVLGVNQVSRRALVRVAQARAAYAEYATGRNCRPSNERLAADTGLSVRTVQRADTALRLLGVATEVLRGRQRTRAERFASWRVGDRGRGWASVWALHDHPGLARAARVIHALSPHPEGSLVRDKSSRREVVTTPDGRPTGAGERAAPRRASPDRGGAVLARAWRADPCAPPWALRYSSTAWARLLASPARHGWTARDLNQVIGDWVGVGHWLPDAPHRPIGLLGAILAWHGSENLSDRPAALDEAREVAELAAHRARLAAQLAERAHAEQARAAGRVALSGPGHAADRRPAHPHGGRRDGAA
jgi:hypothetical protein